MTTASFTPSKPAHRYSDEEIENLDLFKQLNATSVQAPEKVLIYAREEIAVRWAQEQMRRSSEHLRALVNSGLGIDHVLLSLVKGFAVEDPKLSGIRFEIAIDHEGNTTLVRRRSRKKSTKKTATVAASSSSSSAA